MSNREKKKVYYVNQSILESRYSFNVKAATDYLTRYLWLGATLLSLGVKICERANEIIFC